MNEVPPEKDPSSPKLVAGAILFSITASTLIAYLLSLFFGLHLWMFPFTMGIAFLLASFYIIERNRHGTK